MEVLPSLLEWWVGSGRSCLQVVRLRLGPAPGPPNRPHAEDSKRPGCPYLHPRTRSDTFLGVQKDPGPSKRKLKSVSHSIVSDPL